MSCRIQKGPSSLSYRGSTEFMLRTKGSGWLSSWKDNNPLQNNCTLPEHANTGHTGKKCCLTKNSTIQDPKS